LFSFSEIPLFASTFNNSSNTQLQGLTQFQRLTFKNSISKTQFQAFNSIYSTQNLSQKIFFNLPPLKMPTHTSLADAYNLYYSRRCVKIFDTLCDTCALLLETLPHDSCILPACEYDTSPNPPATSHPMTTSYSTINQSDFNSLGPLDPSRSTSPVSYAQNIVNSFQHGLPPLIPITACSTGALNPANAPTAGFCDNITNIANSAFSSTTRNKQAKSLVLKDKGKGKAKLTSHVATSTDKPFSILSSPAHSPSNSLSLALNHSAAPNFSATTHSAATYSVAPTYSTATCSAAPIYSVSHSAPMLHPSLQVFPNQSASIPSLQPPASDRPTYAHPSSSNLHQCSSTNTHHALHEAKLLPSSDPPMPIPVVNPPVPIVPQAPHVPPIPQVPIAAFDPIAPLAAIPPQHVPDAAAPPAPPIPNWLDITITANQVLLRFWKT
jgi:hypothetical protein